ncbi:MAG: hypothetical protein GXO27_04465 [Chlorobi bacterium]|nr:hypothetical protein [Chlorobiota bacterium]
MKRTGFWIMWLTAALWWAGCEHPRKTLITGKIVHADENEIKLSDDYLTTDALVTKTDRAGNFRFELELPRDRDYFLKVGRHFIKVYARPGDSIHLYADFHELPSTAHFSGTGSAVNNLWLDLERINARKQRVLRSMFRQRDTFNIAYIIKRFRQNKMNTLAEYKDLDRRLLDNEVKKRITEHYLFTDDWYSYELYNARFPDRPVNYRKEFPFRWDEPHHKSYPLLKYAYRYFMNRHRDQKVEDLESIYRFVTDVDTTLKKDPDLAETVKLVNMEMLLQRDFFRIDHDQCNRLFEEAHRIFRSPEHRDKFFGFLEAFFSSVKGGYFPPMEVTDIHCRKTELSGILQQHPLTLLVVVPDTDSLPGLVPRVRRKARSYPIRPYTAYLHVASPDLEILKALLPRLGLDEENQYILKQKKTLHFNYWNTNRPLVYVIDSSLVIRDVIRWDGLR